MGDAITLRCSKCGLPWAKLRDGVLEVQSRHNGVQHINRISVSTLVEVGLFHAADSEYVTPESEYHDND